MDRANYVVAEGENPEYEKILVEKAPNGKWFVTYGVGVCPCWCGPFNDFREAQRIIKMHRPTAKRKRRVAW